MTSERSQQFPEDITCRAGLTLSERLTAMNPSGGRMDRRRQSDGKIRWRVERRVDIARVNGPMATSLDPPLWLRTFRAAYAEAQPRKTPDGSSDGPLASGLLASIAPVLAEARRHIEAALQGPASRVCPASEEGRAALVASLEVSLRERLYAALSRTLVLELAVASQRNVLAGKSPEARFAFFCGCLGDPDFARALLEQYPVLVRRVVTITGNWQTATVALLSRLGTTLQTLHKTFFSGGDPGPLVAVETSGDTHCNGQAVHILTFADGQRLVYKPRSLALESSFFDLVGWLNRSGCEPDLKEVRTLDEGGFGWMEFVEAKPCRTGGEIEHFFTRQGAQVALNYVRGGRDLHFENVIAHGEYPVLVDLETLFQVPLLPKHLSGATALGWRAMQMSVMGTLLLPQPMFVAGNEHWIDLSALGHREGQLSPFHVPVWHDDGTDRMRLLHERLPMAGGMSLPEYDNLQTQANPYVDLVVNGLGHMYEFLRKQKAKLLSEDGPLASCLGKPARHVFRGTAWYSRVLDESYHPRFLTDAIASEAFLHNRLRAGIEGAPWLAAIEDHEVASLFAGDIPYFASRVGERMILTGSETTDLVLPGDGWKECRARIEAMSDADRDRQTWLVRAAMTDLSAPVEERIRSRTRPSRDPTPDKLLSTATRIGERICDIAIENGERATWLVPEVVDEKRLLTNPAGYGLYSGLPGIALFLAHLGSITGNTRFSLLAIAAMSEALELYKTDRRDPLPQGTFNGIGGFAYVLLQLAPLLDRPDWLGDAIKMLHKAAEQAARSSEVDIISGQAGLIVAALAVHRSTNDAVLIRKLRPSAHKLRQLAISPSKRAESSLPMKADAGLAHGRAGIGFALSCWADATGEDGFRATASELFRFDLEAIDTMLSESLEKKKQAHEQNGSHLGWCRGWIGIALSTLQTKDVHMSMRENNAAWFRRIADEIISFGVEGPICLCHGALGQMEFLATAAERGMLRNFEAANEWRRLLLARLLSGDWIADEAHSLESPGLMLGLAGTGYALLRAIHPHRIPSVLTVELPSDTKVK
jgi:type 2 lantibiotic biosynthesis protein LanM